MLSFRDEADANVNMVSRVGLGTAILCVEQSLEDGGRCYRPALEGAHTSIHLL